LLSLFFVRAATQKLFELPLKMNGRRNTRDMPMRRRHEGLTPLERMEEQSLLKGAISLLQLTLTLVGTPLVWICIPLLALAQVLVAHAVAMRAHVWSKLDPINKANRDRGINSFTREECYAHLRFHREVRTFSKQHKLFKLIFLFLLPLGFS
jgi:hypothetical protein